MTELEKKYFPEVESLNKRYPCVFVPGIFSYRLYDYKTNPKYWGIADDTNNFENRFDGKST